jgi:hypothetical protein
MGCVFSDLIVKMKEDGRVDDFRRARSNRGNGERCNQGRDYSFYGNDCMPNGQINK